MNKLLIHETFVGTPIKVEMKYCWQVVLDSKEYSGKFRSKHVYDTPDEARSAYQELCKTDEALRSIQLSE
jgi:hypothetical protein